MPSGCILVVDDDPIGLKVFKLSLERGGYTVHAAWSVRQAMEILQTNGTDKFDAVVADYQLPGQTGLDLLEWIKGADSTLEVIIVTSQSERNLIRASLKQGACDFLEKPISPNVLNESVANACVKTKQSRQLANTQKNVRAVAQMNQFFKSILVADVAPYLEIHYTPNEEVGGDFINVVPCGPNKVLMLVGDVSGHDLRAGFVSAYFQGLVRGLSYNSYSIVAIAESFNKILLQEWARRSESSNPFKIEPRTTLSLLAVEIDQTTNQATILNCGAPAMRVALLDGTATQIESRNMPLGWSASERLQTSSLSLDNVAFLFLATDGVHDYATTLGMTSGGLAYKLLHERVMPPGTPPDDLLLLRYQHARTVQLADIWHPIARSDVSIDLKSAEQAKTLIKYVHSTLGDKCGVNEGQILSALMSLTGKPVRCCIAKKLGSEGIKLIAVMEDKAVQECVLKD